MLRTLSILPEYLKKGPEMLRFCWSGKEDSNLRPLPPEDDAPAITRRFSVLFRAASMAHDGTDSRLVPGIRFRFDLQPLSMAALSQAGGASE